MTTRRGKRSEVIVSVFLGTTFLCPIFSDASFSMLMPLQWLQAFWPSIVMKKWLNIQPKVYDFSEDEVDTETESEDDGIFQYDCLSI